jgi:hypothetical protein
MHIREESRMQSPPEVVVHATETKVRIVGERHNEET